MSTAVTTMYATTAPSAVTPSRTASGRASANTPIGATDRIHRTSTSVIAQMALAAPSNCSRYSPGTRAAAAPKSRVATITGSINPLAPVASMLVGTRLTIHSRTPGRSCGPVTTVAAGATASLPWMVKRSKSAGATITVKAAVTRSRAVKHDDRPEAQRADPAASAHDRHEQQRHDQRQHGHLQTAGPERPDRLDPHRQFVPRRRGEDNQEDTADETCDEARQDTAGEGHGDNVASDQPPTKPARPRYRSMDVAERQRRASTLQRRCCAPVPAARSSTGCGPAAGRRSVSLPRRPAMPGE